MRAAAAYASGVIPSQASSPLTSRSIFPVAPGIAAAIVLGVSDVRVKIVAGAACDVLTMLSFRSVIGLVFITIWLRLGPTPPTDARVRWISIAIGVLFTVLIFCLFKAIELNDVPTAVLTYFAYPLLTGLASAATGLEPLRRRGVACALAAFCGLAIMIGAHPAGLALGGIAYALGAASCRTDARLTTWYSVIAQTAIFVAVSAFTRTWQPPLTDGGWVALVGMSLATTAGILFIFVSTLRIGPFRTALIMNLEPLIAMVGSALVLGDLITPLQGLGSGIMLAALVAFQLLR